MRRTVLSLASIATVGLLGAGCTSSATQVSDEPSPRGSVSSAASMAEALDCDLKPLLAAADGAGWVGATEQEALTAYREDLSLDSTSLIAWTGQRPARPAERLWLVVCPGRGWPRGGIRLPGR